MVAHFVGVHNGVVRLGERGIRTVGLIVTSKKGVIFTGWL